MYTSKVAEETFTTRDVLFPRGRFG